ncbi:MAG: hypothetical protein VX916_04270 [Planctomycetota bacterium]|nr:hypothetical protein [Planctomycetota bacterium]
MTQQTMNSSSSLSPEDHKILCEAADRIARYRLTLPAMMFLETITPMNMVTSTMMTMASPLWKLVLPSSQIDELARIFERRDSISEFVQMIDQADRTRRGDEAPAEQTPGKSTGGETLP